VITTVDDRQLATRSLLFLPVVLVPLADYDFVDQSICPGILTSLGNLRLNEWLRHDSAICESSNEEKSSNRLSLVCVCTSDICSK